MYVRATSRDHGFLYCELMQSNPERMFYSSFNARLLPVDDEGEDNTILNEDEAVGALQRDGFGGGDLSTKRA